MLALVAKRITVSAYVLALLLFSLQAGAQGKAGTKFRGVSLNQSIDEVQKIMESNGFKPRLLEDPVFLLSRGGSDPLVRVQGRDSRNFPCGQVWFSKGRAVQLSFYPCYFRMDSNTTSRDLAQAMVKNFPIPKLDVGSRLEPGLTRAERVTYYYGRLDTGEGVEISIDDSPEVVITPGEKNTGGPVFK